MGVSGLVGSAVECTKCGHRKSPRGRSAPLPIHLCDWECEGYYLDPFPGDLWPGETAEQFGYPCQGPAEHWPDGTGAARGLLRKA